MCSSSVVLHVDDMVDNQNLQGNPLDPQTLSLSGMLWECGESWHVRRLTMILPPSVAYPVQPLCFPQEETNTYHTVREELRP